MNSGKNMVRIKNPSQMHVCQPTQKNQCSSDPYYLEIISNENTGAKYELDSMTNVHTQQSQTEYQSLSLKQTGHDENQYQGIQKNGAESGNIKFKEEVKRMKLVLAVMVIVNIVMLLLVTAVAILGTCGIQGVLLTSGQCTGSQNVSTSQFSQLIALTQDNISMQLDIINSDISHLAAVVDNNISMISTELNETNSAISELAASTQSTINQISMQLNAANSNITSVLNQLDTTQTNISYIAKELDAANSNISSVQTQVGYLHPCGPGEWHRVAYLNMGDPAQQCPSAWREYNTGGVRACGRPSTSGGSCPATIYSINFQYSRVCGRVVGYQYGTPDAFHSLIHSMNINLIYLDGISITRGSPREHVWTFAAGESERGNGNNCPCSINPGRQAQPYVENNYYCESGNPSDTVSGPLYTGDKLWDGLQCEGSCCTGTDTPLWFKVQLSTTTSDDIEIRICGNEGTSNEDTPVELIEIYAAQ